MVVYGIAMLAPAETRAALYLPKGQSNNPKLDQQKIIDNIIEEHGLNDPFPIQYGRWVGHLVQGDWGWSPSIRDDVLPALLHRTPATIELTLFSMILLIPAGIISGVVAGTREKRYPDLIFRVTAFIATSIPPFILALILLSIFYAVLSWFPPGRIGFNTLYLLHAPDFKTYTGFYTIDGFLNNRIDITLDALRHLILPAITLTFAHWATLGRLTRQSIIEELTSDYITTARSKGLPRRRVIWVHTLKNALIPALNSTALSAASIVTGVYVVEVIYGFPGVSSLITQSFSWVPDTSLGMGFAVYSVLMVLPLMLVLDLLQALVDPRIRERIAE